MNSTIEKALNKIATLDELYANANPSEKGNIISSLFPENLVFDGVKHRTIRINEVLRLIFNMGTAFHRNKKRDKC